MEPPGLDFGVSSLDFEASRLDCGASRPPAFLWSCFPHSATRLDKCGTVSCLGFLPFLLLPSQQPCQSVGGGGVPPWGPSMKLGHLDARPMSLIAFLSLLGLLIRRLPKGEPSVPDPSQVLAKFFLPQYSGFRLPAQSYGLKTPS